MEEGGFLAAESLKMSERSFVSIAEVKKCDGCSCLDLKAPLSPFVVSVFYDFVSKETEILFVAKRMNYLRLISKLFLFTKTSVMNIQHSRLRGNLKVNN